ncbi:MAG: peptide chain release factor N(5)-glutamine methyltransferase [Coriobacteriia bacterium]|nr:peptide chain release factor N(5)-glutamine methyltransferase [Coriobacteriia bacterium]
MSPAEQVWTVKAALDWTSAYLTEKADEHPRRSAEWLLSAATGLSRVEIYAHHDRPLTEPERSLLREGVRRRAAGEPLQYVTGEVAFRHIVVKVRPGVLIPRPETEVLVDEVLPAVDVALAARGEALIADVCTGSGCIALAIAQERPGARVIATDISPIAVEVATANAERLSLADRIDVVECDLLGGLASELRGRLDVIVSNPPYIPTADVPELPTEVAGFEPHLALDGGADGLVVYRRLLVDARQWLRPGGILSVELDERMARSAAVEAEEWYQQVRVVSDLAGRDRIVVATAPETT